MELAQGWAYREFDSPLGNQMGYHLSLHQKSDLSWFESITLVL